MLIIPAIDIQDGCVVRFVQGKLNKKIYSRDPVKTAKHWVKLGAEYLHVVDLDGAFTGRPKNLGFAKDIARSVSVPVQFGGGIRTAKAVKDLLDAGFSRVILGTRAVTDKDFLRGTFAKFKEQIIVSVDTREGAVVTSGWKNQRKGMDAITFCLGLKEMGFRRAIFTDTLKDGTLAGPNIQGIKRLLSKTGLTLIASGGISSIQDVTHLIKLEKSGLEGVIIGKALYEGKFTLSEALKLS
jgi:phosphoribosylformimino-5-aminoimidazole carboxamide ribotide isomerase